MRPAMLTVGACVALALGMLVYATERDTAHVALMPAAAARSVGPAFGALGQWLPSFVHPFAFSLLWAATRPIDAPSAYAACVGWWVVNVAFEIGQHPSLNAALSGFTRDVLGGSRATRMFADYFLHGTFDAGDIAAATAGAMVAAMLLTIVGKLGESNAR